MKRVSVEENKQTAEILQSCGVSPRPPALQRRDKDPICSSNTSGLGHLIGTNWQWLPKQVTQAHWFVDWYWCLMIPLGRSIATILIPAFLLYWHGGASAGNRVCAHGCRCRTRAGHPKGPLSQRCLAVSSGLGLPALPLGSHAASRRCALGTRLCGVYPSVGHRQDGPVATARKSTESGIMRENPTLTSWAVWELKASVACGWQSHAGHRACFGKQGTQAGGLSCWNWVTFLSCSTGSCLFPLLPSADSLSLSALHYDQSGSISTGVLFCYPGVTFICCFQPHTSKELRIFYLFINLVNTVIPLVDPFKVLSNI